jgi:serine protease Do
VQILRDGKSMTVQVTVGETPRDRRGVNNLLASSAAGVSGSAALGLRVAAMDADTRKQLGLPAGQGVVISEVTGPVAGEADLQAGDVVLMVNQQRIANVAEFQAATKDVQAGSTVLLLVRRGDQSRFVGLTVPAAK